MEVDRRQVSAAPEVLRDPAQLFAPPAVIREQRADGTVLLSSPMPLGSYPRCIGEYLEHWARAAPRRPFLQERGPDGRWHGVSYAQALARVRAAATWLLERGESRDRPVAILADNSIEHGILALACMHVGIPAAPISPAYALLSKDFGKLKAIIRLLDPAVLYVADATRYAPALAAIEGLHRARLVVGGAGALPAGAVAFPELLKTTDQRAVDRAYGAVTADTLAKLLFTSGSTDEPKAVLNTQRMLCANQQALAQLWPFLKTEPPVIVDWLPWNHTFGGNHNFNIVLRNGGTLYIDAGRPMPGLFDATIANLRDVAPTIYFNVPRGYDMLVSALQQDEALRKNFFRRLQLIFYAAAALPQNLWEALETLAHRTLGTRVPMISAWGATETAPLATNCHFQAERSGVIGLPAPGSTLKLVPNGDKLEVRVKGPNVTPGYWRRSDLTTRAFDEEGYYRAGDAVRYVDAAHPERGLLFDGRVSEDFKLATGTWVNVGALRIKAIAALAPVAQDIVVTGHDRDDVGFLIFPNLPMCRRLCAPLPADAPAEQVLAHPAVREAVVAGLAALKREGAGSSTFATRALFLLEPPSIDAGEITDKGYINQRAVLERRAALVETLYREPRDAAVMQVES